MVPRSVCFLNTGRIIMDMVHSISIEMIEGERHGSYDSIIGCRAIEQKCISQQK